MRQILSHFTENAFYRINRIRCHSFNARDKRFNYFYARIVKAEIAKVLDTVVAVEVVLPPNMLAVLTNPKAGLPMIVKADMKFGERRPDGQPAAPASFTKYQKVIRVVVETEDL